MAAEKDISLQFRGSRNQRVLDLPKTLAAGQPVIWEHLKNEKNSGHPVQKPGARWIFIRDAYQLIWKPGPESFARTGS